MERWVSEQTMLLRAIITVKAELNRAMIEGDVDETQSVLTRLITLYSLLDVNVMQMVISSLEHKKVS